MHVDSQNFERSLLLVIPSILQVNDGEVFIDRDFAHNLEAYLDEFETVTVACPVAHDENIFPATKILSEVRGKDRARIVLLPQPYREDRYIRKKRATTAILEKEIDRSRYILVSPHAPFDWSTLAAEICIRKDRKYNMEADANIPELMKFLWNTMPGGVNKIRKKIWLTSYVKKYWEVLGKSSLSLLQGEDVFKDYSRIAPNPHSVLNVQITKKERISNLILEQKIDEAKRKETMRIVYAGRAIELKGPMLWLQAMKRLRQQGVDFQATWFGTGDMFDEMRSFVELNGLQDCCILPGKVPREDVISAMQKAHAFVFCHMGKESPRCLVEALAAAAPLVGFGTDFSHGLVQEHGGGAFVEPGDTIGLASTIQHFATNRDALTSLISDAAASGSTLDRDKAIAHRIALMKKYL